MNEQITQLENRIEELETYILNNNFELQNRVFEYVLAHLELGNALGIGIRASQDSSALLDVVSINKGVCFPNLTTTQRNAISNPKTGLLVYDKTINEYYFYNGSAWGAIKGTT